MEPFLAQIIMFAGNFEPRGWKFCDGQILSMNEYQALYSLLGTRYGGDGTTDFALPDLRGRTPIGFGEGPGLTPRNQGQQGGVETVALKVNEIASHEHQITSSATSDPSLSVTGTAKIKCNDQAGNSKVPEGNYPAATGAIKGDTIYSNTATADKFMNDAAIDLNLNTTGEVNVAVTSVCENTGEGQSHENMQPWLGMNYIIAVEGLYPARN